MTAYFRREGTTIDYTASGADVDAGDVVEVGDIIGVAADDIADGDTGTLLIEGVFDVPAPAGTAFSAGDCVDWDGTDIAATANGGKQHAVVVEACASAATRALIKLTPFGVEPAAE
jgi:predicted RecA/RadA family phage recombinase